MTTDRIKLAEELEAAEGGSRELFERALAVVNGPEPDSCYNPRAEPSFAPEWKAWTERKCRFLNLVQFEAWEQAAALLVPKGWDWSVGTGGNAEGGHAFLRRVSDRRAIEVDAATPALALASASLRAGAE